MTNTTEELVDRLRKAQQEMRSENQPGWQNLLDECFAALSTVTSEEVAQQSEFIDDALSRIDDELHGVNYGLYCTIHNVLSESADLLQRLDRELGYEKRWRECSPLPAPPDNQAGG